MEWINSEDSTGISWIAVKTFIGHNLRLIIVLDTFVQLAWHQRDMNWAQDADRSVSVVGGYNLSVTLLYWEFCIDFEAIVLS